MSNSEKGACLPTILGATAGGHPHAPLHPHFVGEPLGKEAASSISSKQESKEDAPEKGSNSTKTPVVAVAPDNAKRQIEQAQPQGPAPLMLPIPARKVPPPRVVPEWELTSIAAAKAANEECLPQTEYAPLPRAFGGNRQPVEPACSGHASAEEMPISSDQGPFPTPRSNSAAPPEPVPEVREPQPRLFDEHGLPGLLGTGISQGGRNHQEDRVIVQQQVLPNLRLCAVLDGHNGSKAVEYVEANLAAAVRSVGAWAFDDPAELEGQFAKMMADLDEALRCHLFEGLAAEPETASSDEDEKLTSGCVACITLQRGDQLYVAKVGDCQCWASTTEGGFLDLSGPPHHPQEKEERERLAAAGVDVETNSTRLHGLAVSRALGDFGLVSRTKPQGLTTEPFVAVHDVKDFEFLLVTSDGVPTDDPSCVIKDVRRKLRNSKQAKVAAQFLADLCGQREEADNTAVVVVVLQMPEPLRSLSSVRRPGGAGSFAEKMKQMLADEEARREEEEKRKIMSGDAKSEVKEATAVQG